MKYAFRTFRKEFVDSVRERRAIASAVLLGPLFGPALFGGMFAMMLNIQIDEATEPLDVPIIGGADAINLKGHLGQRLIDVDPERFEDLAALREAVRRGDEKVGLVVDAGFADALRDGAPARVWIVVDRSNATALTALERVRAAVAEYGSTIGMQRLQLRGIDPRIARPFAVLTDDVSTPSGRSVVLLGMMTYFLLFAMMLGGLQVAIDTTAGERERGSLEPLLTLPVRRRDLVVGKVATAVAFMAVSLALGIAAFATTVQFLPLAKIGMTTNLTPAACLAIFAALVPFAILGAGLLTLVASFTRSFREAQTYTSFAMIVPPLPVLLTFLNPLQPSAPLMLVPSLSQHLLVTAIIKGQETAPEHFLLSAAATVTVGVLCTWGAVRRFRSEKLLV